MVKKLVTVAVICTLSACSGGHPAYAEDKPDFDPFAQLTLKEGESMKPLECMPRAQFEAGLKAHDGSQLMPLQPEAAAFYRGYFSAQPFTPAGYPVGDGVELAVRAITGKDDKPALEGVAVFTLGDNLVCNHLAIAAPLLDQLFKAGGARGRGGI